MIIVFGGDKMEHYSNNEYQLLLALKNGTCNVKDLVSLLGLESPEALQSLAYPLANDKLLYWTSDQYHLLPRGGNVIERISEKRQKEMEQQINFDTLNKQLEQMNQIFKLEQIERKAGDRKSFIVAVISVLIAAISLVSRFL